jgi:hypothetical protein
MLRHRHGWIETWAVTVLAAALALAFAAQATAQSASPAEQDEQQEARRVNTGEVVRHDGKEETKVTAESGTVRASATATVKIKESEGDTPEPYDVLAGANEQTWLALAGWSSKYRIGLNTSEGDWVRYEITGTDPKETVELLAKRAETGDMWIIEKHAVEGSEESSEIHMLFASGKPRLLEAFRVDDKGGKTRYDIPDPQTAGELVVAARDESIENVAGDRSRIRIVDCTEREELKGQFGTLDCQCLEVRVAEELSPISFERFRPWIPEGTILWFSTSVPRLVPVDAILLPALVSPDEAMVVQGGMVRSPGYELVDYSGRLR